MTKPPIAVSRPPHSPATAEFGARVRSQREALGLSQEAAAVEIGIHWTELGKIERGQRGPRLENILRIAQGLQTSPGALLDGLPVPSRE
ncbi:helix-turn-helix domain-containing protein [Mycobacteroides abscessus]|uniref:helix-turn-helix domain-containing protein n=1 Tax=Mycobacteroides abscessus TaxID=36809 RepID=UPI00092B018A|nr:helix-turn-helix transcriptional regulator [Mycobacteroides abscessus]SHV16128.1 putative transcriptional regulator [Mycobacteroides abscessus subsp. abscessus]SHV36063.1 putative transcriptional regulator [Mycobacteroides abscessus subsp. abscessus]SHV57817.1 putative transcriptional regulator [Mycobacteroides abscessus subsp. abscessus]SHW25036.1 putative transcriptional regulator [Mycobacteroides abscessus subsp. abscessus]SHW62348.1 putative transcriptional regulator [Mycobacteroides ab